jgi:hypothetical protein
MWDDYEKFREYLLQHPPHCKGCTPRVPMVLAEEWPSEWRIQFICTACGDKIFATGFPGEKRIVWDRKIKKK